MLALTGFALGLLVGLALYGFAPLEPGTGPTRSSVAPNRGTVLVSQNLTNWSFSTGSAWSTVNFTAPPSGFAFDNVSVYFVIHGCGFRGVSYFARLQAPSLGSPWGNPGGAVAEVYGTVWATGAGPCSGFGSIDIPTGMTELVYDILSVGAGASALPTTVTVTGY